MTFILGLNYNLFSASEVKLYAVVQKKKKSKNNNLWMNMMFLLLCYKSWYSRLLIHYCNYSSFARQENFMSLIHQFRCRLVCQLQAMGRWMMPIQLLANSPLILQGPLELANDWDRKEHIRNSWIFTWHFLYPIIGVEAKSDILHLCG